MELCLIFCQDVCLQNTSIPQSLMLVFQICSSFPAQAAASKQHHKPSEALSHFYICTSSPTSTLLEAFTTWVSTTAAPGSSWVFFFILPKLLQPIHTPTGLCLRLSRALTPQWFYTFTHLTAAKARNLVRDAKHCTTQAACKDKCLSRKAWAGKSLFNGAVLFKAA